MAHMATDIYLCRRTESDRNLGRHLDFRRHTSFSALTQQGAEDARPVRAWLRAREPGGFGAYFISPSRRTMQTAVALGFEDARWRVDPRLIELSRGLQPSP